MAAEMPTTRAPMPVEIRAALNPVAAAEPRPKAALSEVVPAITARRFPRKVRSTGPKARKALTAMLTGPMSRAVAATNCSVWALVAPNIPPSICNAATVTLMTVATALRAGPRIPAATSARGAGPR